MKSDFFTAMVENPLMIAPLLYILIIFISVVLTFFPVKNEQPNVEGRLGIENRYICNSAYEEYYCSFHEKIKKFPWEILVAVYPLLFLPALITAPIQGSIFWITFILLYRYFRQKKKEMTRDHIPHNG